MTEAYRALIDKSLSMGALGAKIIDTKRIVFDPRAFLKCRFGCNRWGRYWTCPPHMDLPPERFMEAFSRYQNALILRTKDPKSGQEIAVAVEKAAMLSFGCGFAFAMALCVQCETCAYPEPCLYPHVARPAMDAYGIDIAKTIAPLHFKVEFDEKGALLPSWYSMVLLE
ncbi:MAG: DUF2284 domain-containing protein [Deltaproteobacteria bacterium]|nr:DUF2284 domain-containing protein [Deltaproteobacteria bacterium]MBW1956172.1 DUF2284 domain-containing protein [Deltaproteobacteria bacterium]MBW2132164.1 DUF2284 domain-containing protein [Deltaproteobacteria bacterium]